MPADRILGGGTAASPERPDVNIVAANADIVVTTTDDNVNMAQKIVVDGSNNAAYANSHATYVVLSSAVTSAVVARWTPPVAGKITKISCSAVIPVATGSKLATFTPAISGVSVSGCALNTVSSQLLTMGNAIYGTSVSGLNAFTAAQEITIVASNVTAFVEGTVMIDIFYSHA